MRHFDGMVEHVLAVTCAISHAAEHFYDIGSAQYSESFLQLGGIHGRQTSLGGVAKFLFYGRVVDIEADYVGFDIPDEFVVGYGLDFNQKFRNLPFVGVLKEECYRSENE